jgi:hypothetical protein
MYCSIISDERGLLACPTIVLGAQRFHPMYSRRRGARSLQELLLVR